MKQKLQMMIIFGVLLLIFFPLHVADALEPGEPTGEYWTLQDTTYGVPDKLTSWTNDFMDLRTLHEVTIGETGFYYHIKIIKAASTTTDAFFTFTFDTPSGELVPGDMITLRMNGSSRGTLGTADSRLTLRVDERANDGTLIRELGTATVELSSDKEQDSQTLQFIVPVTSDEKLEIKASLSQGAQFNVVWMYMPGSQETVMITTEDNRPGWVIHSEELINSGAEIYVPDWLEWIKPKRIIRERGIVMPGLSSNVWVYDRAFKKWKGPLQSETTLRSGDIICTGPDSPIRVMFSNQKGKQDTISVGGDTLLEIPEVQSSEGVSDWPTFWSIYEGGVKIKRAILREAPITDFDSPFVVRTPSVVCGTRDTRSPFWGSTINTPQILQAGFIPMLKENETGIYVAENDWGETADFVVLHDYETQTSVIYVLLGELNYYNLAVGGSESSVLYAGQSLTVNSDGAETVQTIDQNRLDSLIAEYGIQEYPILDSDELEKLFDDSSETNTGNSPIIPIVIVILVIGVCIITVWVLKSKRRV